MEQLTFAAVVYSTFISKSLTRGAQRLLWGGGGVRQWLIQNSLEGCYMFLGVWNTARGKAGPEALPWKKYRCKIVNLDAILRLKNNS